MQDGKWSRADCGKATHRSGVGCVHIKVLYRGLPWEPFGRWRHMGVVAVGDVVQGGVEVVIR